MTASDVTTTTDQSSEPPSASSAGHGRSAGVRGARVGFLVVGAPLTALIIAAVTFGLIGTLARQSESTTVTFAPSITSVEISVGHGSVTVRGSDRGSISGERVVTRGLREPTYSETVSGSTLKIEADCVPLGNTWCDVSYVLDVPEDLDVRVRTTLGPIQVTGTNGSIAAESGAGPLSIDDVSGALHLDSGAGGITVTNATSPTVHASSGAGWVSLELTAPPDQIDASAGAGSVDVVLPQDDTAYRVVEPDGEVGDLRTAVLIDPSSDHVLTLSSGAGSVSVHYPEA